ncbi:RNA polymerase subunit sigma-70 [Paenibacillus elgii]|uniref:RNA polymerase sigma factor n=1 Tax=Paenibacillus elgii TaxID=189691 RepID=A0A165QRK9_9BACL|nr:RNA polymerase sigma factor [Paenibacillus elgii]KZE76222.1 RNA polymerase subunit sigma-70 [Paenibacillus elgii]
MKEYLISEEQSRAWFEEHSPYVYGIALMMTKSAMLADDITQETFLRAYRKFHLYDPTKPLRPWLYRITLNMVRSTLRKQRWLTFFGQLPVEAGTDSVEDLVLKSESEHELWQVVNRLSSKRREVLILVYYVGLSLQETASLLNIRLGTCKSRLHAALEQLRNDDAESYQLTSIKEGLK